MTATWTGTRTFGRSGTTVSALGLGTWAIGGPAWLDGKPIGWGQVDDAESLRTIHRALDLGITFFDTAPVYGAGRSERLLGQALAGRHDATIATKFGLAIDEDRRLMTGIMTEPDPALIRSDCEVSLRRLNVEAIDLFLCHPSELPVAHAAEVRNILEDLVAEGKIRGHGWSTDDVAGAAIFAAAPHCSAVEHELNLVSDAPAMLALCERENLASITRSPLAMGLLTGKFDAASTLARDDVRGDEPAWLKWFANGRPRPEFLQTLAAVRHGPLAPSQMAELDRLLGG